MSHTTPNKLSRRLLGVALGVVMAIATVPASASASQVMFENGIATYKPSGGEWNVISTTMDNAQTVRFKDAGAVIWNAGPGCQIVNDNEATCTQLSGIGGVRVGGGSFDDQIDVDTDVQKLRLIVESGSDDDVVNVTGAGCGAAARTPSTPVPATATVAAARTPPVVPTSITSTSARATTSRSAAMTETRSTARPAATGSGAVRAATPSPAAPEPTSSAASWATTSSRRRMV